MASCVKSIRGKSTFRFNAVGSVSSAYFSQYITLTYRNLYWLGRCLLLHVNAHGYFKLKQLKLSFLDFEVFGLSLDHGLQFRVFLSFFFGLLILFISRLFGQFTLFSEFVDLFLPFFLFFFLLYISELFASLFKHSAVLFRELIHLLSKI